MLSREALRRFYQAHQDPKSACAKDGPQEDVRIALCLRTVHVFPGKSVDKHNRELFHPFSMGTHFAGTFPDLLKSDAENPPASVRAHSLGFAIFYTCMVYFRVSNVVVMIVFHFITSVQ